VVTYRLTPSSRHFFFKKNFIFENSILVPELGPSLIPIPEPDWVWTQFQFLEVGHPKDQLLTTWVKYMEKPLFLFLFVFWGISSSRRSLASYAVGEILLCSHVPMFPWKDFMTGQDQENLKTQGGKGQIRKIQKKQEGKNGGKKKKRFFWLLFWIKIFFLTQTNSI